ncbi:hypothetical protein BKA62DRAFT_98793 [Auriculariales sp. MPI-PUGE-AT-0066]|nr:hypothetical protein BKA62DRAFT_98793 [Auriculariales sp. MPI-PUGE-AT-0066]
MTMNPDKLYEPDRLGEESSDNARVWRIYRNRATEKDEDIIDGWNKTLDVLLIFAGLFSAVVTGFLIEVQKQLTPDTSAYLAAAFLAIHRSQSVTADKFDPSKYIIPYSAQWVTALWLVSLVVALIVALLASLCKQ